MCCAWYRPGAGPASRSAWSLRSTTFVTAVARGRQAAGATVCSQTCLFSCTAATSVTAVTLRCQAAAGTGFSKPCRYSPSTLPLCTTTHPPLGLFPCASAVGPPTLPPVRVRVAMANPLRVRPRGWLLVAIAVAVALGAVSGDSVAAHQRRSARAGAVRCTQSVCRAVVGMPHRSLHPFGGAPADVIVPLHLVWPARLGVRGAAAPPVPLVVFLAAALATPCDTASLRAALGRHTVVAAPSYAARNFTPPENRGGTGGGPPGGPPAGDDPTSARLFVRFLTNVAAKGGRDGCPARGVLSSAALVNSVLAVLAAPSTARGGRSRVAATAAAAAAADPARLVLAGHSMGAAIALTAATGGCATGAAAALPPFLSRILCEGYTPPVPPTVLRGVVAYAATPPAARSPLPPGLWVLAMDGDTDTAVANLAGVAAGYAPATPTPSTESGGGHPTASPSTVLLTAGLVRAGHFAPVDYVRGVSTRAGAPRCTTDNAGDGPFVTTRAEAATARRRFVGASVAVMAAALPARAGAPRREVAAARRARAAGCAALAAATAGRVRGVERVTLQGGHGGGGVSVLRRWGCACV